MELAEIKSKQFVLFMEPDEAFESQLQIDPNLKANPLFATNARITKGYISNLDYQLFGVFLSMNMGMPELISMIHFARVRRPIMPIFLIKESDNSLTEEDITKLGITKIVDKTLDFKIYHELVVPKGAYFDRGATIATSKNSVDEQIQTNSVISESDDTFIPISAKDFLSGSSSLFDVYVRLNPQKYVKVLKTGETFPQDRLETYLKKITHFHIKKAAHENYIAYCNELSSILIQKSEKVSTSVVITQTLNYGDEIMKYFAETGLTSTSLQYMSQFADKTKTLVKSMLKKNKSEVLEALFKDMTRFDHATNTSMIVALLIEPMGIDASKPVQIFGLTAMLHDVGLQKIPAEFRNKMQGELTPEEFEVYSKHPILGADILREIKGIDASVIQGTEQHHERKHRKGYPGHIGSGAIIRVAEIIGICDDFSYLIQRQKKEPTLDILTELDENVYTGFSVSVVETFEKVFFPDRRRSIKQKAEM